MSCAPYPVLTASELGLLFAGKSFSKVQASNAQSDYLMLVGQQSNNYLIQPQQTQTVLDVSPLTAGNYTLALVCDGVIADTINLIMQ